jgi:hypothetical protein
VVQLYPQALGFPFSLTTFRGMGGLFFSAPARCIFYNFSDIFKVMHCKFLFSVVVLVLDMVFISLQINVLNILETTRRYVCRMSTVMNLQCLKNVSFLL